MDLLAIITILGFLLTIFIIFFTSQGEELRENILYLFKKSIFTSFKRNRKLKSNKLDGKNVKDKSKFIRDVNIPDGTKLKVNQKFIDQDLNFLLSSQQFTTIKNTLKTETMIFINDEIKYLNQRKDNSK